MRSPSSNTSDAIIDTQTCLRNTKQWLEQAVLGLNLCPFAAKPWQENRIEYRVSQAKSDDALLEDVLETGLHLARNSDWETSLLIIPSWLGDFFDYNQFLDLVDALFQQQGWEGQFQIASFHPEYQFAGTAPEDNENLTNRAPYPILHFLREESLEKALDYYPDDADEIPTRNIATVNHLSTEDKKRIFHYLYS